MHQNFDFEIQIVERYEFLQCVNFLKQRSGAEASGKRVTGLYNTIGYIVVLVGVTYGIKIAADLPVLCSSVQLRGPHCTDYLHRPI